MTGELNGSRCKQSKPTTFPPPQELLKNNREGSLNMLPEETTEHFFNVKVNPSEPRTFVTDYDRELVTNVFSIVDLMHDKPCGFHEKKAVSVPLVEAGLMSMFGKRKMVKTDPEK
jgi:hypothetical protein